ncbi:STAS/SEC14 domain-containing protein [Roseibium sp.]|uniref:STAS/SEC14 domain-containing protein n=1 Tax=Roseibium sp. TaxID=1936156 RepID=UPI0039EE54BB
MSEQNTGGIEYLDLAPGRPDVIAIRASGETTGEAMHEFIERIKAAQAEQGKIRLYVDLTGYEGFEWSVVGEKLANFRTLMTSFDRLAYVVDKQWMASWISLVDAVTPMQFRAFKSDQADAAIEWITAD